MKTHKQILEAIQEKNSYLKGSEKEAAYNRGFRDGVEWIQEPIDKQFSLEDMKKCFVIALTLGEKEPGGNKLPAFDYFIKSISK